MLGKFNSLRQDLQAILAELQQLASERHMVTIIDDCNELKEKLVNNRFHLVVLGEFKRGKTTFINALLGQELLPSGVIPVTAIITVLKYGPQLGIQVFWENQSQPTQIPLAELSHYISETHNPLNGKKVAYVEVEYPSPILADGVLLIDTPGVGSIHAHNTETAYDFLPQVDAAIFLISVDPPVSRGELEYLEEIQRHVPQTFLIQNKIDYVTEEKLQESLQFCQRAIGTALGKEVQIFPLSAQRALEARVKRDSEALAASKLPHFQETLEQFFLREKGKALLHKTALRLENLTNELQFSVALERKAQSTPLQELTEKITLFEEHRQAIITKHEQNGLIVKGKIEKLIAHLEEKLASYQEETASNIKQDLADRWQAYTDLSNRELANTLDNYVQDSIIANYIEIRQEVETWLRAELNSLFTHYTDQANLITAEILRLSAGIFDLQLPDCTRLEPLTGDSKFYFKLEDAPHFFTMDATTIAQFLPRSLAQKQLHKHFMAKIPDQVDRTSGRVRHDFVQRVKQSFLSFQKTLNEKITATDSGVSQCLQTAIARKRQHSEMLANQDELLKQQLAQITAQQTVLATIIDEVQTL